MFCNGAHTRRRIHAQLTPWQFPPLSEVGQSKNFPFLSPGSLLVIQAAGAQVTFQVMKTVIDLGDS